MDKIDKIIDEICSSEKSTDNWEGERIEIKSDRLKDILRKHLKEESKVECEHGSVFKNYCVNCQKRIEPEEVKQIELITDEDKEECRDGDINISFAKIFRLLLEKQNEVIEVVNKILSDKK